MALGSRRPKQDGTGFRAAWATQGDFLSKVFCFFLLLLLFNFLRLGMKTKQKDQQQKAVCGSWRERPAQAYSQTPRLRPLSEGLLTPTECSH